MPANVDAPGTASDRFPSQVRYIIGTEACERYSFYGMKGILNGYITGELMRGGLGRNPDTAAEWIHSFIMLSYFTPLLGAWISDRFWGKYRTILWISLLYCVGHGVLAMADLVFPAVRHTTESLAALSEPAREAWRTSATAAANSRAPLLVVGLTLIGLGAGGIKPCVSAFMGDQFPEGKSRLYEKAFAAFYFSINFGSFFSFLTIPFVAREYGYALAFGIPGILMAIATTVFYLGTRHYRMVPPASATKTAGFFKVFFAALGNRKPGGGFWDGARATGRFTEEEVSAAASVAPVLSIFALIPPFWALFDQHSSTWLVQADSMIPVKLPLPFTDKSYTLGGPEMQSLNPAMVMLLIPVLTMAVYPALRRFTNVTPLRRIGSGLFLVGLSYVVVAWIQQRIAGGEKLSVLWQTIPYLILTTAEVLVSTTGIEFAYTQAARSMKSTITSFWFLSVTAGNALVVLITRVFGGHSGAESVTPGRFMMYAGLSLVAAVVFVFVAMLYRYRHVETKA